MLIGADLPRIAADFAADITIADTGDTLSVLSNGEILEHLDFTAGWPTGDAYWGVPMTRIQTRPPLMRGGRRVYFYAQDGAHSDSWETVSRCGTPTNIWHHSGRCTQISTESATWDIAATAPDLNIDDTVSVSTYTDTEPVRAALAQATTARIILELDVATEKQFQDIQNVATTNYDFNAAHEHRENFALSDTQGVTWWDGPFSAHTQSTALVERLDRLFTTHWVSDVYGLDMDYVQHTVYAGAELFVAPRAPVDYLRYRFMYEQPSVDYIAPRVSEGDILALRTVGAARVLVPDTTQNIATICLTGAEVHTAPDVPTWLIGAHDKLWISGAPAASSLGIVGVWSSAMQNHMNNLWTDDVCPDYIHTISLPIIMSGK